MPSVAVLPSLGPFGRVVDMRVFPHGFTTQQGSSAGPVGSAIVRPNVEDGAWHSASSAKWGGNIVWTGSTPRHTVAYNGPRGRWWGAVKVYDGVTVQRPFQTWFSHNGQQIAAPGGLRVLGACLRVYDSLPTEQTYAGTGDGTLTVQSPSTAPGALTGDYEIRCIGATAPAHFLVTGPDAVSVGVATAGVLFDGVVKFLIATGLAPFVLGDTWTLTVEEAEQFLVLGQNIGGPIAGPDTAAADQIYRRGVSLTGPWRLLANIPAQPDEYFPVPQPWFINASATQAVTSRIVDDPLNGGGGRVRLVDINLQTFAVTRQDQGANAFNWTAHVDAAPSDPLYSGTATRALSMLSATLWRDWAGDSLITCTEETQFSYSHTWDGESGSGAFFHASGAKYARTDLVIEHPGGEWRRTVVEDAISATLDGPGLSRASNRALTHAPIHGIAITPSGILELLETAGTWTWSLSAWSDPYTTSETVQVRANGTLLAQRTGGGTYPEDNGGSGDPESTWIAFGYSTQGPAFTIWYPDPDDHQPVDVAESAGGGPYIAYGTGALISILGMPLAFLTPAGGQVNNRLPAVIGGTWAVDARGNFISIVEAPVIVGGYQAASLFPMSTDTNAYANGPRHIGVTYSGTYTLQAGGPDSLTPSQVHTLTAHPGADMWNVGAF